MKLTTRDATPLGLRMTERMSALGLDDRDVAKRTSLNYSTIRSMRRRGNKNPRAVTIAKVAEALAVTTAWLAHGTVAPEGGHQEIGEANQQAPTYTVGLIQKLKRELAEAYAALSGDPVERVNITITIT
jgi:transcriptional regulator with XRE-family HTH domain